MNISIPMYFDVWNLSDFFHSYKHLYLNSTYYDKVIFDMSNVEWITPTGIVALTSFVRYLMHKGVTKNFIIEYPRKNSVNRYLDRIDFYKNIGSSRREVTRRDSTGRFCELSKINSIDIVRDLSTDLVFILNNEAMINENMIDDLHYCLGEIMENIFHHSKSPIQGYVCAQSYPQKREIEFAIADAGVGFRRSLINNDKYSNVSNDKEAIQVALKKKATGRPNNNAGEGLFFIKEALSNNNGVLSIYSGCGKMILKKQSIEYLETPFWNGTIVSLIINMDINLNMGELFEKEMPTEEADGFDFVF